MSALTIGSLFAGIGGLDLGLERGIGNGAHTVWQVEQNEYCRRVLARHWPDALRYDDVCTAGAHNLSTVDVLCGGFPCQDVSQAGRRAGVVVGTRSGLWFEYSRIIRELRPCYVVVENVAALLTLGLDAVLGELAESGYDAEWRVLSARGVGAPHLRERVFVLAYPQRTGWQRPLVHNRLSRRQGSTHTIALHGAARPWLALDDNRECLRAGDGVSVTMERERLHALGNAVVPQVAEVVGRLIAQMEAERLEGAA